MGFFRKIKLIFISLFFIHQENYEIYLDIVNYQNIVNSKDKFIEYQLLFSRVEDIYLVFYDKQRKDIYVQFKEDPYDDINDKIKKQFISGQPYRLKIQWIGIIKNHRFFSLNQLENNNLDLNSSLLIFKMIEVSPLLINEIQF